MDILQVTENKTFQEGVNTMPIAALIKIGVGVAMMLWGSQAYLG